MTHCQIQLRVTQYNKKIIIITKITKNLYCATKRSEQTQQRRKMHNGYMTHNKDLLVYCRAFPPVKQGTILNTFES